ncbi:P-loop containing nucleoside triphosphate hydrolase protein [Suillus fuscotomentosus]|uniref:P-loop containing nucleoside triphosphate hydrolase protein n=2 Tax=Suillus TaxID=5379 RepID=A0AAD4E2Z3_9AGAM|nr:P-loop containing nucleoside triphosphate hydrolase protein [Suillus fuscotomentosus]KAG1898780.1 P-loop containing nucleoside triphosphate hydrolase protein [Suillus fuscotomentosus]
MQDLHGDSPIIYKTLQDLTHVPAPSVPEPFSTNNQAVFQVMSERFLDRSNETWWTNRARSRSVDLYQFADDLEPKSEGHPVTSKNIVIFGETGVGKSSLINLIAGEDIAPISPDALPCTTEEHAYEVEIRGQRYTLHDTVGLGGGSYGSIPTDVAPAKKLKYFLTKMSQEDGLHLLVYCVRGSRATRAVRHSYETFAAAISGMKIPVVLAVTCVDDLSEAGDWWRRNGKTVESIGIRFDSHACVCTLPGDSYRDRRYQSKIDVCEKISELCDHDGVRLRRPRRQRSLPFTR